MYYLYRHFNKKGDLLYIGISYDWINRTAQHRQKPWWTQVSRIQVDFYNNETIAYHAERKAIKNEKPLYNTSDSVILLTGKERKRILIEFNDSEVTLAQFAIKYSMSTSLMARLLVRAMDENNRRDIINQVKINRKIRYKNKYETIHSYP